MSPGSETLRRFQNKLLSDEKCDMLHPPVRRKNKVAVETIYKSAVAAAPSPRGSLGSPTPFTLLLPERQVPGEQPVRSACLGQGLENRARPG